MTGIRYWHVAYRLYVRYRAAATPEPIEGLYFVRSDCNNPLIAAAGNRLTDFRFHRASIQVNEGRSTVTIQIESPDAAAYASLRPEVPPQRAPHSAFSSLDQAAAFLKYKPAGISLTEDGAANVVHITRSEATWQSKLVQVETATWEFLKDKPAKPEICFQVEPISYQWNRGEIYRPAAEAG
jgi:hypothetical protein